MQNLQRNLPLFTLYSLAGGRNKSLAALAYDLYNKELKHHGFQITVPQTFREVSKRDVPAFVEWLGGRAVVKNPYSNAGQGYTFSLSLGEKEVIYHLGNAAFIPSRMKRN
jgi:hypothetical protein